MVVNEPVETRAFVVVGVDFGTTFTGVAYSHSNDPDFRRITVIENWPGAGRQTKPKVPTEISYSASGEKRWGWQLASGTERFGGFKLRLDPEAGNKAYNDEQLAVTLDPGNPAMKSSLRPGSSATDMTTDYLRLVYTEVMSVLARRFPSTFGSLKFKFVITTPAMWSPAAQHNTLMAAKTAGFASRPQDIIEPVTEPEAAASYALKELNALHGSDSSTSDNLGWQIGNQVIICDAGGGTVDLVSYAIDQVQPYLSVSETIPPRGGLCGATSLDERFLQLLRQRLGSQARLLDGANAGRGSTLMTSFDHAKQNFGTDDFEDDVLVEHKIRGLVRDNHHQFDEDYITLTHMDMKSIFDPVVGKILALVEGVANEARNKEPSKPVVGIILVGGFGESVYLYKRLHSWGQAQSRPLYISNPKASWAAIATGAVCFGLEGIVHRRVLPCHYGVELDHPYNSAIHNSAFNYTDEFHGQVFNRDTMTWFAKLGQVTDREHRITVPCQHTTTDRSLSVPVVLRVCRYNEPPSSRRDARILSAPSLTLNLAALPSYAFREKDVREGFLGLSSHKVYSTDFTLEMVAGSASLRFEIRHKGELLSSQNVDPGFVGT